MLAPKYLSKEITQNSDSFSQYLPHQKKKKKLEWRNTILTYWNKDNISGYKAISSIIF